MGCANSKKAVLVTPALDSSGILREASGSDTVSSTTSRRRIGSRLRNEEEESSRCGSGKSSLKSESSLSVRLGNLHKYIEGEQVAAGWPSWLCAVAGEALQGWVPLKAESFEKLEKIGQGTYSSVFRANDLDTGKVVALKKVRFDNYDRESVRFMAREINILRRLDHPNVMKLEGLITSRSSCSLYLVFEYMEHDLAGLSSCPDITFSEPQIKCYMHQLLSGVGHCHSHGVIHRDIKGANLLLNNEGILKIADFGLANYCSPNNKQPLTSRVVTLWYRPPELLLGSTDYEASVDLWSVGCVFAELYFKKPILQGRTEVEQLHKIFKLCGSPAEEYWKKSKLPHATIFKPHRPYDSCLHETFKTLPSSTYSLLQTLLSVEPYKRGTATTALESDYFKANPCACEPSSLPKYPPNKEIDAKCREDSKRKRTSRVTSKANGLEAARRSSKSIKTPQELNGENKLSSRQEELKQDDSQPTRDKTQEELSFSGPMNVNTSSGFAWVKKTKNDQPIIRRNHSVTLDPSNAMDTKVRSNGDISDTISKVNEQYEITRKAMMKKWNHLERPDSFNNSETFRSQGFSKEDMAYSNRTDLMYRDQGERVEFSGPLLTNSHKVDELLRKHERNIRRKVWFLRAAGRKQRN